MCTRIKKNIRCPYHSWAYDLEGNCLGTPLFEGSDIPEDQRGIFDMSSVKKFSRKDYGLLPVPVESWGFLIFVNLNPDAAPLAEDLGDLPDRLGGYRLNEWQVVGQKVYEIGANYKLIGENFMEYYHLPWVHPELVKVSRMEHHYRWQGPGMYTGMCTSPISQNTGAGGWLGLPAISGLSSADAMSARFIWLFPNLALNVLPNHCFVMLANPTAPDHTVETTWLVAHPESMANPGAETTLEELAGFWNLVNVQDIEIVERVQQGLQAKAYRGGRMCFRFEEPLHRFQNMIIDRMVGLRRIPPGDAQESVPMFTANGMGYSNSQYGKK
jgi:choline monooxygenase